MKRDPRMILASDWIENVAEENVLELSDEVRDLVVQAVDSLPPEDRDIIEAIIYERLTFREAAERFGYAAHSQLYYKYRDILARLGDTLQEVIE